MRQEHSSCQHSIRGTFPLIGQYCGNVVQTFNSVMEQDHDNVLASLLPERMPAKLAVLMAVRAAFACETAF